MRGRRIEFLLAAVIYFVTIFTLLMTVYQFLENWNLSELNFFIAGILVILVALGWGYVLIILLLSPQKKMEDTFTTLTNDIIHELNIPLSTIRANTEMLKKTMEADKSLKRLTRIENATLRLEKLYNELVYSINYQIHTIEKECFDVASLLKEQVSVCEEQKRNPFKLSLDFYEIVVDKIGFEQMVDNLLSNAMKYSSKRSLITLTLNEGILMIKDEGIGMSDTELLRVYERYFQSDEIHGGEGIGLSLVKNYCDNADIDIQIKSKKGVGTEIHLNLMQVHV